MLMLLSAGCSCGDHLRKDAEFGLSLNFQVDIA